MEWIYDSNKKIIRECKDDSKEIDLTVLEGRLIEVLCNNLTNSWKEIFEYVYSYENKNDYKYNANDIKAIKCRLLKKVKLNIKNVQCYGLQLEDRIFIV